MKIALVAMSGIRAHDPELLELGLTLPGFVERSKQIAALPNLGLLILAALTPDGHELSYHEVPSEEAFPAELLDCDLVAISTLSAQAFEAYAVAGRLRERGVRVALGGLHASAVPEEALERADDVVVGEGERVWPELVRAVEAGEPGRLWRAADFPPVELAEQPAPRYDLLSQRTYNRFPVQTTRGCPWRCEFCASTVMLGQPYRKRPVEDVVRDVRAILERFPRAFLEFADDNTFVDRAWGLELCRALAPLGVRWFTETDASVADDPELLEAMARAGCRQLLIGFESPAASELAGVEAVRDFKRGRASSNLEAIRRIQERGITVNGCFVLGLDGQDEGAFERVLDFAREAALWDVQVTVQTPFPGTPLYARLEREGRLLEAGRWDLCTLFDINYEPRGMDALTLRAGLHQLCRELYTAEAQRARRAEARRQRRRFRARVPSRGPGRAAGSPGSPCATRPTRGRLPAVG